MEVEKKHFDRGWKYRKVRNNPNAVIYKITKSGSKPRYQVFYRVECRGKVFVFSEDFIGFEKALIFYLKKIHEFEEYEKSIKSKKRVL